MKTLFVWMKYSWQIVGQSLATKKHRRPIVNEAGFVAPIIVPLGYIGVILQIVVAAYVLKVIF
jgi:hypothetical protein